ncbi:MAG: putative toxin-antitoxin system toxin component, PIN family, partial [Spirochaetales bacterium]|nr:putative toxin-antitoxin system toxin component, PIN family [Spirochaetales bacterium]
NVFISGVFFGGKPRTVLESIVSGDVAAFASRAIIEEYSDIILDLTGRKQGALNQEAVSAFVASLNIIETRTKVMASRDPDDDKFIECALDAGAVYIISGDKDLLSLEKYRGVTMITAADFVAQFISAT